MDKNGSLQVIDIEKELKKLWDENEHEKKVKACLFTLIVYVREGQRGDTIRQITQSIIQEFPCRMISIFERSSLKDHLSTEVSQYTSLEGGVLIASDQISITASPNYLERIPFIVTPEIVPDLPVYIIWGADLQNCPLLKAFEKLATKIIFDADCSPPLPSYSKTIYEKIGKVPYELQDFHWALSGGWRECLFQGFNNEEGVRFLGSIESVHIVFNDIETNTGLLNDTLAWYVQAWLASSLNWKLKSCRFSERKAEYTSLAGPINVELNSARSNNFFQSAILSIEIKNRTGDTYAFMRHPDRDKVILHVTRKNICDLPALFPFPDLQRGFNFMRELFFFVESDHYAKTLKCLSELKG